MPSFNLQDTKPILYKFYSHATIKALVDGTIAFTPPNKFNDPFEFLPRIVYDSGADKIGQLAEALSEEQWETVWLGYNGEHNFNQTMMEFKSLIEQKEIASEVSEVLKSLPQKFTKNLVDIVSKNFGIACLSKDWSNPLMWAHYSGGFKGFCVGYKPLFFTSLEGLSQVEVEYSKERYPLEVGKVLKGEISEEDAKGLIRTKYVSWTYEKEVRFIMKISNHALKPKHDRSQFYLNHHSEAIDNIIVGMRCSEEDRKELRKLRDEKYPNAEIFETIPSDTIFEVTKSILN